MSLARRLIGAAERPMEILGAPGMIVGVVSVAALGFSLIVQAREYDLLRRTGRELSERAIEDWVRSTAVDEVGRTVVDYADSWRSAEGDSARVELLRGALAALGVAGERQDRRFAVVSVARLEVSRPGGAPVASWFSPAPAPPGIPEREHRFLLLDGGAEAPLVLIAGYRPGAMVEEALARLETSYRRLLLAVLGLSGYSLLCLGAMVVQARILSDRAARESAQVATLDLADRTCHELGNVVFVLANERRNLAEHLDQFELLLDRLPVAVRTALADAGLEPGAASRALRALDRRLAEEGLDPEVELRNGARIARDVARQIDVCSQYIALTVRELDGFLKQSTMPVEPTPTRVLEAIDEALTLLGPRIESAMAEVDRPGEGAEVVSVLADRRLLVHALVNLLKNALEATARAPAGDRPRIALSVEEAGAIVRIGVRDNGPGIPEGVAARVFEPGFSTKGRGRGRGLVIARDSIRSQGGTLRLVRSPAGEPGACFLIELPSAVGTRD
ncbi:sensor histidine kinase [Tautonia sociabilis]|uniref:histidine kinase n=1 Tax=Tautonia sociabilis TaxID=2080755 RepID=A0A432MQC4_9BACT|nr:ATP-binding protein [Tautonia sociabilis]RUL89642.1 hypothetical protein TsocGM_00265 [Tautonia sociabilis]